MTENEVIEALKLEGGLEITGRPIRVAQFFEGIDTAIKALGDVQRYQSLEKRLTDMFGSSLSLEAVVDELERQLKEPGKPHPINAKILTYEDATAWEEYQAIGTPEECRAAMEIQEAEKVIEKYKSESTEDIEAFGEDAVFGYCPVCGNLQNTVWNDNYCGDCGQKLDWSDKE